MSVKAAIIGSGNIGVDLMMKVLRSDKLELAAMVGIDPESDGLARAAKLGVEITHHGLEGLRRMPGYKDIQIVYDATSAKAHLAHAPILKADGKQVIDLTPAAIGPYAVPAVNFDTMADADNVNMVTCGGQATIPIVAAVSRVGKVEYAEIVATISSRSAGPGTRANIDEFTQTTARGIEVVGGARQGKAIIILNPAEPPLLMRATVYCLAATDDEGAVRGSIQDMVAEVHKYVPGYRLKQDVQFEKLGHNSQVRTPDGTMAAGLKVSVFLEVEGAGDYLPKYAGNLDIITSASVAVGERVAERNLQTASTS